MPYVVREIFGRDGSMDSGLERNYSREFLVDSPYADDSAVNILALPDIPKVWNPYVIPGRAFDLGSWCRSVNAQLSSKPYIWTVKAQYSSKLDPGARPDQQNENPLLRPSILTWGNQKQQIALEKSYDANGDWGIDVVNSAFEKFDPPPEIPESMLTLVIERNEATFPVAQAKRFQETINEAEWFGFDAETAKCESITGAETFENGLLYCKVRYEFHIRPEGKDWSLLLLDIGPSQLIGGAWQAFTPPRQGLLDGSGEELAPGGNPVYIQYFPFAKEDFDDLNLP